MCSMKGMKLTKKERRGTLASFKSFRCRLNPTLHVTIAQEREIRVRVCNYYLHSCFIVILTARFVPES